MNRQHDAIRARRPRAPGLRANLSATPGIDRELAAECWEHFLARLAAYAQHSKGSP